MTLNQFLAALRKTSRRWKLKEDVLGSGIIRNGRHCPISAVAGKDYCAASAKDAATYLGLPWPIARRVVAAADNCGVIRYAGMRAELLKACDLKEVK